MDFSEKLLALRRAHGLTQEQLAEKLGVSRQSVSKWESGQAVPELEKLLALSTVFDVSTDSLLKSSPLDDLSLKTDLLERQQQALLARETAHRRLLQPLLQTFAVYFLYFTVCILLRTFLFWSTDLPLKPLYLAGFWLSTALVVLFWAGALRRTERSSNAS